MASQQVSVSALLKPLSSLVKNFHLTLFFVVVIAGLVAAVILINQTVIESESESSDYTSSITPGSIDEATLQRLQSLQPSSESSTPAPLPEGRINPFGE